MGQVMEEMRASKQYGGALPFLLGFLVVAVAGWVLFPDILFVAKEQPFRFSHVTHVEGQGMACEDCHYFREDGTYAGFPTNEECASCHDIGEPQELVDALAAVTGSPESIEDVLKQESGPEELDGLLMSTEPEDIKAEREFVVKYLARGKEVPWYNYQFQPDNVYFSHKAHAALTMAPAAGHGEAEAAEADAEEGPNCNLCHPKDIHLSSNPAPFMENIFTGYSKKTMKMWECERCHAQMHQDNACYVCHK
ncbi:MAG: cytochrome c3 family protein [Desulfovibrio sp.]